MMTKRILMAVTICLAALQGVWAQGYKPTEANLKSRQEFSDMKLGIFLHWGIYSTYAQGEWYLENRVTDRMEYAKAADAFYPHRFDARAWVRSFKEAGAKYICITSRHHDGFSMWKTAQSPYNIVEATPFGRDVLRELSDACREEGMRLHFYYSHLDWMRPDYPQGRTGTRTGRPTDQGNWESYFAFMNAQLTELLTNYGPIGAIWFDGWWDHEGDKVPFDWHLPEQYELIHRLQPSCLVGNNHHKAPFEGEDIQIFERDLPGEMTTGFSDKVADVSSLPLETCQTMNGMWGYKVEDTNYKSSDEIIRLLVSTSGKGANLLMNIGPQANGELPAVSLQRLKEVGQWLKQYGPSIYATRAGDVSPQAWGVTTRRADSLFVHVTAPQTLVPNADGQPVLYLPMGKQKVKAVTHFLSGQALPWRRTSTGIAITLPAPTSDPDYVMVVE